MASREELQELYEVRHLSTAEIGPTYGVSSGTIRNALISFGIPRRGTGAAGFRNRNWKGGRQKARHGYIRVWVDKSSPLFPMCDHHGTMFEHRLVMAQHLGRCLEPDEVVHHINGVKSDNSLENLELVSSRKEHLPSMRMQQKIKELEKQVRLLKWQIRHLNGEVRVLAAALQQKLLLESKL